MTRSRRSAPVDAPDAGPGRGRRVLVVDSDPETRALCRDVLERLGFAVEVRDGGVAALATARQDPPALILLDLQLRDVEGLQFIAWLRSDPTLISIPVIVMSTTAEDAARLPAQTLGTLLRKPLTAAVITRAVRPLVSAQP